MSLAAAAAAWALSLPLNEVSDGGLLAFQGNLQDDPARFNVLESSEKDDCGDRRSKPIGVASGDRRDRRFSTFKMFP